MKNIKKIIMLLLLQVSLWTLFYVSADAASFSVSTNTSKVDAGGTISVTINANECGGAFSISATNGATVSSSSAWVESGSSTITVTAPQSGSFSVNVSAKDVAGTDGMTVVSGTKSVSASVNVPVVEQPVVQETTTSTPAATTSTPAATTSTATTTKTEVKKSSVNTLSSLTISEGELSPKFDASTTTYSVEVEDIEKLKISATVKDSKSKVSGAGTVDLEEGKNSFSLVVTAEDGSKKTYKLNITLTINPEVYIEIGENSFGVVNNPKNIEIPGNFKASTMEIDEIKVTSWIDENSGLEIICLVNEKEEESFYVIEEGEVISAFRAMSILGKNVYVLDISEDEQERTGLKFEEVEVEVDGDKLMGWTFDREELSKYTIIRVMRKNGNMEEYLYSTSSNTMIIFDYEVFMNTTELDESLAENEELNQVNSSLVNSNDGLAGDLKNMKIVLMALSILTAISTITLGVSMFMGRGYKKDYLSIREKYEGELDTEDYTELEESELSEEEDTTVEEFNELDKETAVDLEETNTEECVEELENHKLDLSELNAVEDDTEV